MSQLTELYNTKYLLARSRGWSGWGSKGRAEGGHVLIDRIMRHPLTPQSGRCLELGCGEGQLSRKLARLGFSVTGIDISSVAIEWAKEKQLLATPASRLSTPNIDFRQGDLTTPGLLLGRPYDFVLDGHCLHCIAAVNRPVFLANVFDSLTQSGIFIVSSRCTKACNETVFDSGLEYRHFHQPDALLKELRAAGFEILDVTEYDRGEQVHLDVMLRKQ
jgi:2-polyprenyl-3-methyl-5-hydroxy-6-metoxy-1,4-benzoquinol methylase